MPRPRFAKLEPKRREQIIEAAAREFGSRGLQGASLNRILQAGGLSKGAAYYYFDDKTDLFATVGHHLFDHLRDDIEPEIDRLDAASFWPEVESLYLQLTETLRRQPWMLGVAQSLWRLTDEERSQDAISPLVRRMRGLFDALVERGQAAGVVRTDLPNDLLVTMAHALHGAAQHWLQEHETELLGPEIEALSRRVVESLRRLLAPGGLPS